MTLALVCLTAGLTGLCASVFLIRNREVVSAKFRVAAGVVVSVAAGVVVIVGSLSSLLLGPVALLVTVAPGISIS